MADVIQEISGWATGGFTAGCIGGSVFHFINGIRSSSKGQRILGGFKAVRINSPRVGYTLAAIFAVGEVFDSSLSYFTGNHPESYIPYVSYIAAAALVAAPRGLYTASKMAAMAAVAYPTCGIALYHLSPENFDFDD